MAHFAPLYGGVRNIAPSKKSKKFFNKKGFGGFVFRPGSHTWHG